LVLPLLAAVLLIPQQDSWPESHSSTETNITCGQAEIDFEAAEESSVSKRAEEAIVRVTGYMTGLGKRGLA
jgi:hypothetical protein